jgi:hypothetical protein
MTPFSDWLLGLRLYIGCFDTSEYFSKSVNISLGLNTTLR